MSFLQLVRREMHGSMPKLLFMSSLGGISNASILAAINTGVQDTSSGQKPGLWAASLFLVALFLFMKTQQFVTITATAEIEAIIHKMRLRLMDLIRRSELLDIEKIGRARIVASITSDTAILTQASNMLCFTVQGAVLILFVGLYVAYLSITAFLLTLVIVSGAATIFHYKNRQLTAQKGESAAWERRLFDRLTDFLDGFKEVNDSLGHERGDDVLRSIAMCMSADLADGVFLGRLGGDEFLAVLSSSDVARAQALASALVRRIERLGASTVRFPLSASVGVATGRPNERPEELVRRADQAMYRAKAVGSGRCELDDTPSFGEPVTRVTSDIGVRQ